MNKKPVNYTKRPFSYYQKTQTVTESKQHYFHVLPFILGILELFLSVVLIAMAVSFPEVVWLFFSLWLLGTVVIVAGILYGKWVKKSLFGKLMKKRKLEELYQTMNPLDFEHFVAEKFRRVGYKNVTVTPSLGDGGIDILMEKEGKRYAAQCKKYHPDSFVKIDELRAFVYAYRKAGAQHGIYVTTANFSSFAKKEMAEEGVELIDGARLLQELE